MGKRYSQLKAEIKKLREEAKELRAQQTMLASGFVSKHKPQPGELVVFRTENLGMSFGLGVVGMTNIQQQLSKLVGGQLMVMGVHPDRFAVETLTTTDQRALRTALDKLEAMRKEQAISSSPGGWNFPTAPDVKAIGLTFKAPAEPGCLPKTEPKSAKMTCPACFTVWPEGSTTCFAKIRRHLDYPNSTKHRLCHTRLVAGDKVDSRFRPGRLLTCIFCSGDHPSYTCNNKY